MSRPSAPSGLAALLLATMVALAGCDGGGSAASRPAVATPSLAPPDSSDFSSGPVPVSPVALADHLLGEVRVPRSARRMTSVPTAILRRPEELVPSRYATVRARWWRIDRPWHADFRHLVYQPASDLLSDGATSRSSGPSFADDSEGAGFRALQLTATINSARVELDVAPRNANTSEIAAFVTVVRQPKRPSAETVPATVDSVTITRVRYSASGKHAMRRGTVTGPAVSAQVRAFDHLVVAPIYNSFSCPMEGNVATVSFRAGTNVWRARSASCGELLVTLNGRPLLSRQDDPDYDSAVNHALLSR